MCSFADGGVNWRLAKSRFKKKALRSNFFNSIFVADLGAVRQSSLEFALALTPDFLGNIGFGFWAWKPSLIRAQLSSLSRGEEFLVYLDVGCTVNATDLSKKRFEEYLETASESGVLTFDLPGFQERLWTKPEVFEELHVPTTDQMSDQRLAGILILRNSKNTIDLVDEWVEASIQGSGSLIDNHSPKASDVEGFRAHRNDQSLWSVLSKKYSIPALKDETFFAPNWREDGAPFPFWATRLKSVFSNPNPTFTQKAITKILSALP